MFAHSLAGDLPTPRGLAGGLAAALGPNRALPTPSLSLAALGGLEEWPLLSPRSGDRVRTLAP